MTKSKLPKWFKGEVYSAGDVVANPYTGDSIELTADELAMYDYIMGAQLMVDMFGGVFDPRTFALQREMSKGLQWFRKNNAKAYMILLD